MLVYFWRDWLRIIGAFFGSLRARRVETADQKLAWMIICATIPVGLVGLVADHETRVLFAKPVLAGVFLMINGGILYAAERFRTRASLQADADLEEQRENERGPLTRTTAAHASGQRAVRQQEVSLAIRADERLAAMGYRQATLIGTAQILALLAGISRDGVAMVTGMFRGLAREDAVRFAFLLATPVILAAGLLEIPEADRPARSRDSRADPGRQPAVGDRGVRVGALPGPLLPDAFTDAVRGLLRDLRARQCHLPVGQ